MSQFGKMHITGRGQKDGGERRWEIHGRRGSFTLSPAPTPSGRTQPLLPSCGLLQWDQGPSPTAAFGLVPRKGQVGRKGANMMGHLLRAS